MIICISPKELRKALADIEQAEKNGFNYCLSVFRLSSAGMILDENQMEYNDIIEKAHPTDPNLDWGRFQNITKRYKFIDGELIKLEK